MQEFLQTIEASRFAMFVKESSTAYTATLAFHTIGLSFWVGISVGIALRVLGVAKSLPLAPLKDFLPLMYVGLVVNAATGLILMTLYPTRFLTSPTMYVKLVALTLAAITMQRLHHPSGSLMVPAWIRRLVP